MMEFFICHNVRLGVSYGHILLKSLARRVCSDYNLFHVYINLIPHCSTTSWDKQQLLPSYIRRCHFDFVVVSLLHEIYQLIANIKSLYRFFKFTTSLHWNHTLWVVTLLFLVMHSSGEMMVAEKFLTFTYTRSITFQAWSNFTSLH